MQIMSYTALYNNYSGNYSGSVIYPKSWPESKVWTVLLESPSLKRAAGAFYLTPICPGEGEAMRGDGTLTLKWSYFLFRPSSLHPPCDILECKAREPGVEKRGTLSSSVQGNSWLTSFETDAENILLTSCSFCPLETVKGDGRRFAKHKNTMRKIAHEKCIILQGMPTLYSEKSRMISYKEQL